MNWVKINFCNNYKDGSYIGDKSLCKQNEHYYVSGFKLKKPICDLQTYPKVNYKDYLISDGKRTSVAHFDHVFCNFNTNNYQSRLNNDEILYWADLDSIDLPKE